MTISGTSVYTSIKTQINNTENKHEALSTQLFDVEKQFEELSTKREECFTRLALVYLPEMNAQAVATTLREVQADVQKIFKEKQNRRAELEQDMKASVDRRKNLEMVLDSTVEKLGKKSSEREVLGKQVKENLQAIDTYVTLTAQVGKLAPELQKNLVRVEELKSERDEKIQAYTNRETKTSKRFMYLLEKRFDPENPDSKLDLAVANSLNYASQKRNYDALISRPKIAEEEVENRKKVFDGLLKQIRAIEKEQEDKTGFTKVMSEYSAIEQDRQKLANSIEKEDTNYTGYAQERKSLDNTKDQYHSEAISRLKSFLKGEDISLLKQKARATAGSEDDTLVDQIESIDEKVRRFKDTAKKLKEDRDALQEKLEGLKSIKRNYDSKGYNSSDTYFPSGFNIGDLLTGYLLGKYDQSHVDSTIRTNRHEKEPEYTPSYHSSSSSSSWGSSSSGSSFGGSFSSGGGFGGGGFSSGKGF